MFGHLLIYAAPLIRLSLILGKPTFDLLYHKLIHTSVHNLVHHCPLLHHKVFRYLPDLVMIAALLLLDHVTEHYFSHHAASE